MKGRVDKTNSFEISKNEFAVANLNKEHYKLFLVKNTLSNTKRTIEDLGLIFNFNQGEDFFL